MFGSFSFAPELLYHQTKLLITYQNTYFCPPISSKTICSGCEEERDTEEDFRWRYKERKIRQKYCKFCQAAFNKVHYQNNKQVYIDRALTRNARVNEENQRRLLLYLSTHACGDCANNDIRIFEFDHVQGEKLGNISKMVSQGTPWAVIEAEIAKCEVRCVNCHRIKTIERGNWWRLGQWNE